jgi:hypothetical protein
MYQGELLQEVAYILRTQHTNSPAAARTRQAAMDALRHFGAGGVDAYRQARQQGGVAPGMPVPQRDPGGHGVVLGVWVCWGALCRKGGGGVHSSMAWAEGGEEGVWVHSSMVRADG